MNIQQHARTIHIQKLSGYLLTPLTCLIYILGIAWPLLTAAILIGDSNVTFTLGYTKLKVADLSYPLRIFICLLLSIAFFFALKGFYQFRELMRYFKKGEIFNVAAVTHARKTLFNGLVVFSVGIAHEIAGWVYKITETSTLSISIPLIIYGCIFFGLMYVLVWALEIGHDLNEESDLTI